VLTCRTPLRVSFFGGGTDYPEYYKNFPGAVLGTSINKYIYISALRLEPFVGYRYRLSYRVNETVETVDEIEHPVFKAVFKHLNVEAGWNFGVLSSLPSRSGLGSSSSFTVGLLKLISHLHNESVSRLELAMRAIHVERDLLSENVGIQDQLHATFGGLNRYDFSESELSVSPVRLTSAVYKLLNGSLFLIHTGISRYASDIVTGQIQATKDRKIDAQLSHLYALTKQGTALLQQDDPDKVLQELGAMIDEGWKTKRGLSKSVSTSEIDALYETLMKNGALGGKLCGAGGGGFFLAIIPPENRARIQAALGDRALIQIHMDDTGSTVLTS
jgi:D-glycero-alpha-D-manno-heptose-7-phosphate kinase